LPPSNLLVFVYIFIGNPSATSVIPNSFNGESILDL